MQTIAFDTETHLIKPGMGAPKLVCVSLATEHGGGRRGTGWVLDATEGMRYVRDCLESSDVRLVGHHTPYDLGIVCAEDRDTIELVFDAIDRGAMTDTLLRQKIIQNALGELKYEWDEELGEFKKQRFGLEFVVWRLLGRQRDKGEDTYRLRYRELDGVPISQWPDAARLYAEYDAEDTMAIYLHQHGLEPNIIGEQWQMEAAWAFQLASLWGLRTDPERVARVKEHFFQEWQKHVKEAQKYGFVREDAKTSKDEKAIRDAIAKYYKENDLGDPPETAGGKISLKREVLANTDHPGLQAVADMGKWRKLLTTYVPVLEQGTAVPINPSYNPILETFRSSCSRPNVQNLPGKGGVRECFVPRDGWLYGFCDYGTIEMRTLAQVCLWLFGWSAMADALRADLKRDLHLDMAAEILGITYEEAMARFKTGDKEIKEFRKHSKPANFGFPGGMGAKKFITYAKGYGVELTLDQAKELRETFMTKWPEMKLYFDYASGLCGGEKAKVVEFLGSKMLRGDVMYTAVCNGFFQHLAACGAKQAFYRVQKACYTDRKSPLFGCRATLFIHDEIGIEIPPWRDAHEACMELRRIMIETMVEWVPDIPITADPVLVRRWFGKPEPVYVDDKLVPCKPIFHEKEVEWVADLAA